MKNCGVGIENAE